MITFGWLTQSPSNKALYQRYGITNVYKALYQVPNVYTIAGIANRTRIVQFIKEHYGDRVEYSNAGYYPVPGPPGKPMATIYIFIYLRMPSELQK